MKLPKWKKTFFVIWGGQAVSLLTSSFVQFALIWYLTDTTGSAKVLSIAMLVGFLPQSLLSPFIGSFVDRYDRKKIMVISDGGIAFAALILAFTAFLGNIPVGLIYATLFIRSLGTAFHAPSLQAVTPLFVPQEELAKCAGYSQTLQSASLLISPAIAAILYAAIPLWAVISIDIIGAVVGCTTIIISPIPKLIVNHHSEWNVFGETKEGFLVLKQKKGLFGIALVSGFFMIFFMPVSALFPLMSMSWFGGTATHAAVVETVFSAGMLIGGLIIGIWGGSKNKMIPMMFAMIAMGLAVGASGLLPPEGFAVFVILSTVMGLSSPFFSSLYMAMLQEQIPPEYLGRVFGVTIGISSIASPIGLILSGIFAERIGTPTCFLIAGVMTLFCVIICLCSREIRNCDKAPKVPQTEPKTPQVEMEQEEQGL